MQTETPVFKETTTPIIVTAFYDERDTGDIQPEDAVKSLETVAKAFGLPWDPESVRTNHDDHFKVVDFRVETERVQAICTMIDWTQYMMAEILQPDGTTKHADQDREEV